MVSEVAVYVHGLWLNGWESAWLLRRVSRHLGCETRLFPYPSVSCDVATNARALAEFLAETRADTLHLVGHSLGGLVILESWGLGLSWAPGRIVLLASPLHGSLAAQKLVQLPFGKRILGATAADVLLTPRVRHWDSAARDLGIIAGDLPLGLGRLLGRIDAPSDGTVSVEETRLEGAKEHLTLHVSHSGILFSATVARQTACFLRNGRFDPQVE